MKQTSAGSLAVTRASVSPSGRRSLLRSFRSPAKALFVWLIRFYQVVISPGIPSRCKYYPSCSQYALDAVRDYGAARGFVLAVWRVMRCNPLSYGGYDPVSRQKVFRPRVSEGAGLGAAASADGHAAACSHHHLVRG
jgi:putative membrane protein insertion efficiency factor